MPGANFFYLGQLPTGEGVCQKRMPADGGRVVEDKCGRPTKMFKKCQIEEDLMKKNV